MQISIRTEPNQPVTVWNGFYMLFKHTTKVSHTFSNVSDGRVGRSSSLLMVCPQLVFRAD